MAWVRLTGGAALIEVLGLGENPAAMKLKKWKMKTKIIKEHPHEIYLHINDF